MEGPPRSGRDDVGDRGEFHPSPGRHFAANTSMFARHGLEWSRLHAGREWNRLNSPQLRSVLETLDHEGRDTLRGILIHDQADLDAIA